jgi:hypothetical protein
LKEGGGDYLWMVEDRWDEPGLMPHEKPVLLDLGRGSDVGQALSPGASACPPVLLEADLVLSSR